MLCILMACNIFVEIVIQCNFNNCTELQNNLLQYFSRIKVSLLINENTPWLQFITLLKL